MDSLQWWNRFLYSRGEDEGVDNRTPKREIETRLDFGWGGKDAIRPAAGCR